jgi:glycosyltransferase involved in cell wall biosynthesis
MLFVRDYLDESLIRRNEAAPETPLVSVILPTYSRFRCGLLERSIRSVLSQTFRDFELIIVDDGSRDGTEGYIAGLCQADPRVVHVRHVRNSGLPGLRVNEGILLARGPYVAFQFDDDTWRPNFLDVLTQAAAGRGREAVIVGTSIFHHNGQTQHAPFVEVNPSTLFETNRFANNCTLIPRELFDRFGMYDCHLAMRRACDWDLWLRLIKFVPFHVVGEIVADVFTFQDGSIGKVTPWDIGVFRYFHDIPRDHLLTPDRWRDYSVDCLRVGDVPLPGDLRRRVYEEHILPYYLKFRHQFPVIDESPLRRIDAPMKDAILASETIDDRRNSSIRLYDHLAWRRGTYKVHHQHPQHLTAAGVCTDADALLLAGPCGPHELAVAEAARQGGRPVAYLLEENPAPPGSAAAPAADSYRCLAGILAGADAVWVTGEAQARAARAYNRRTVPHAACLPPV